MWKFSRKNTLENVGNFPEKYEIFRTIFPPHNTTYVTAYRHRTDIDGAAFVLKSSQGFFGGFRDWQVNNDGKFPCLSTKTQVPNFKHSEQLNSLHLATASIAPTRFYTNIMNSK